jgi:threonyl-tRNA synthetase
MKKQIREAQLEQYNFMLIVGVKERAHGGADVRTRGGKRVGLLKTDEILAMFTKFQTELTLNTEPEGGEAAHDEDGAE